MTRLQLGLGVVITVAFLIILAVLAGPYVATPTVAPDPPRINTTPLVQPKIIHRHSKPKLLDDRQKVVQTCKAAGYRVNKVQSQHMTPVDIKILLSHCSWKYQKIARYSTNI